jgi:hypothetical protein
MAPTGLRQLIRLDVAVGSFSTESAGCACQLMSASLQVRLKRCFAAKSRDGAINGNQVRDLIA